MLGLNILDDERHTSQIDPFYCIIDWASEISPQKEMEHALSMLVRENSADKLIKIGVAA